MSKDLYQQENDLPVDCWRDKVFVQERPIWIFPAIQTCGLGQQFDRKTSSALYANIGDVSFPRL